jgi:SPP1 gp7 family putative phage head morphogenesis protein
VAVTQKTLRLARSVRADLLKIADTHDRELTAAWADAWDTVAGDYEAAVNELVANAQGGMLSRATILRSRRLLIALDTIARALTRLTEDAGIRVSGDLLQVVNSAGEGQEAIIASQLPKAERGKLAGWDLVDRRQIDAIVQRSTEQITSQMWPISSSADATIRRELVRGLANGSNPKATAREIVKRTEGEFNGGLARAMTIARTETLDAHRAAAEVAHNENADVLRGWMWLATTSDRTCIACLGMNGTEHPLTEPGPQGHQNCRCSRAPVTKSWADLGIDIDEPEPAATGSQAWFDSRDDATQRKILGPAKYAAYRRGDFPMSQWAVKRHNDGWRDSYVPANAPKPA